MAHHPTRRDFLKTSAAAVSSAGLVGGLATSASSGATTAADPGDSPGLLSAPPGSATVGPAGLSIRKGVLIDMLPTQLSMRDRLKLAREVGFEAVQVNTARDQRQAEEIKRAAEDAQIRIDSVMNAGHWKYPLSSPDPAAVAKGLDSMRTSLRNAAFWGARAVLLVPAVVDGKTGYADAWTRSHAQIEKLLPLARQLNVIIALEDVWNKFLLSPLEFATYVDQFHNPWVRAWFDVGNVVFYGYPQDWIRVLRGRIAELHIKDFKREPGRGDDSGCYAWVNVGEGDVDWPAVRQALADIHYSGTATVELAGGDAAYLRDVSRRVDRFVLGTA